MFSCFLCRGPPVSQKDGVTFFTKGIFFSRISVPFVCCQSVYISPCQDREKSAEAHLLTHLLVSAQVYQIALTTLRQLQLQQISATPEQVSHPPSQPHYPLRLERGCIQAVVPVPDL